MEFLRHRSLFRQKTFLNRIINEAADIIPKEVGAVIDRLHPRNHLAFLDAMLLPGVTAGKIIV